MGQTLQFARKKYITKCCLDVQNTILERDQRLLKMDLGNVDTRELRLLFE